jgi:hypothetical protein
MLAMALPVVSRRAAIIASLSKQKPVSSTAMMVPEKARLKSEIFTITDFPVNVVLKADGLDGGKVFSLQVVCGCRCESNKTVADLAITGVIRPSLTFTL